MRFRLPYLYPITDVRLSGLPHAGQVEQLAAAGAQMIQLREKYAQSGDFYRSAADVTAARREGTLIIVNDRVDIAVAVGADGVHVGQDDLPPEHVRRLIGPDRVIGFSTHSVEQARIAVMLPIDYIAAGPVFATSTKDDPDAVIGPDGLARIRDAIGDFPLVAIGGITAANIDAVFASGADSAAVISALFAPPGDISANFASLAARLPNNYKQS